MNPKRIVWTGLVCGLVMAVLDGLNNGVVFGASWEAAYKALGIAESPAIPAFWISYDFVAGIAMAWMCAALWPRFGARSGIYAGLIQWFFLHVALLSHIVDHVFPPTILLATGAGELVSAIVGGVIVAKLYRDTDGAAARAHA